MAATDSLPLGWCEEAPGVFRASDDPFVVTQHAIEYLRAAALRVSLARARVCAHALNSDLVHEMIIALSQNSYVRPHRHIKKSESYFVVSGTMDIVVFEPDGRPIRRIPMSSDGPSGSRYLRFNGSAFHTMIPGANGVIFHEVTGGPLDPSKTEYAAWSPGATDVSAVNHFIAELNRQIGQLKLECYK